MCGDKAIPDAAIVTNIGRLSIGHHQMYKIISHASEVLKYMGTLENQKRRGVIVIHTSN